VFQVSRWKFWGCHVGLGFLVSGFWLMPDGSWFGVCFLGFMFYGLWIEFVVQVCCLLLAVCGHDLLFIDCDSWFTVRGL